MLVIFATHPDSPSTFLLLALYHGSLILMNYQQTLLSSESVGCTGRKERLECFLPPALPATLLCAAVFYYLRAGSCQGVLSQSSPVQVLTPAPFPNPLGQVMVEKLLLLDPLHCTVFLGFSDKLKIAPLFFYCSNSEFENGHCFFLN